MAALQSDHFSRQLLQLLACLCLCGKRQHPKTFTFFFFFTRSHSRSVLNATNLCDSYKTEGCHHQRQLITSKSLFPPSPPPKERLACVRLACTEYLGVQPWDTGEWGAKRGDRAGRRQRVSRSIEPLQDNGCSCRGGEGLDHRPAPSLPGKAHLQEQRASSVLSGPRPSSAAQRQDTSQ